MTAIHTTPQRAGAMTHATRALLRNHIWLFLVLAIAVFSGATPYFLTTNNMGNILTQGAFIGILAIGMTLVILNGEIDLSVGANLALAGALAIGLQPAVGVWPAIGLAFLTSTALGVLNGLLVVFSGMHSFIVTLGGLIGIRGLVFVYTGENALMVEDFSYTELAEVYLGPLSLTAMIFLGLAAMFQWVLSSTRHGRETYSVGDNIEAAHDAGINIKRHKVINFGICGAMAGIAGILLSMRLGTAEPNAGRIWELWTIIAVVLGGTRLQGGYGSLWMTVGGVLTLAVLRNGLRLLNTPNYVELMVMGSVLILALGLNRLVEMREGAR
ncbi:monosaccharide ABC transporter membrane protein, CUT2 family [Tranquillimonas rosea]|uniref:Monosaccharide ABC transporter membrane protein, CUT2 family n=1 Tax=Tranquillimonas rosea TaxID=641238 RepID=A0A1H9TE98_9RHOB|nr:ABC transporter permease [Tranquillimonas rosea]SER95522.1 monosaccharide ABC transporter membrane protein, CUT2 family [Tranquillimonas rosea]